MRRLYLIRHAEAEPENMTDLQRRLTHNGEAEALWLAKFIKAHPLPAATIICSSAQRAKTTAMLIAEQLALPQPLIESDIYEADVQTLLQVVCSIPAHYQTALLVGHNPGLSDFAEYLNSGNDNVQLSTCGVCCLEFPINDWQELAVSTGEIVLLKCPEVSAS